MNSRVVTVSKRNASIVFSAVAVLAVVCSYLAYTNGMLPFSRNRGSEVVCDSPFVDLGPHIRPVGKLRHSFTLRNASSEEASVAILKTSCACTEATVDPPLLKPGQSAALSVTWAVPNAAGRTGFEAYYQVTGSSTFAGKVAGTATVMDILSVYPDSISLGPSGDGVTLNAEVEVHAPEGEPFRSPTVEVSGGIASIANCSITAQTPNRIALFFSRTEDGSGELKQGKVVLTTGIDRQPLVEIPVTIQSSAAFAVEPSVLVLTKQNAYTASARIRSTSGGNLIVKSIETNPKTAVKAESEDGGADELIIRATLPQDMIGKVQSGKILVHCVEKDRPAVFSFLVLP